MRTTLSLDDDVAAAVQRLREERNLGLSDAVNELIRAGLTAPPRRNAFRQRTANLGLRIDVSSMADALAHLAALAIEHGLEVCSNDADFARFSEVRWINPVAPA